MGKVVFNPEYAALSAGEQSRILKETLMAMSEKGEGEDQEQQPEGREVAPKSEGGGEGEQQQQRRREGHQPSFGEQEEVLVDADSS